MKLRPYVAGLAILSLAACNSNQTEMTDKPESKNPLLVEWNTPFGVPPFDEIENAHYLPAFEESMAEQLTEIDNIVNNPDQPTFKNTVEAYELTGAHLKRTSHVFYAVEAANTNADLQETSGKIAPALAAHRDAILLNEGLFARVKTVYDNRASEELSDEENRLLNETYKSFVRAGANVQGQEKERLKEINARLATLGTQFGDNLLAETNTFELHLKNEADVADLPAGLKAMAKEEAQKRGYGTGWVFTTQRPSCNPFLQASSSRDFRQTMFNGYAMRGNNQNENDNKAIVVEMANLRLERAKLLGYQSHAHYVLADNMAQTPDAAFQFMDGIWPKALSLAKEERMALAKTMAADGINEEFKGWDWRYYVEKIRAEKYAFNEEETKPYFEFNAVLDGCFMIANKLFGLSFKELNDLPTWHPDQQVYEVLNEDGSHLGIIYMDFFIRDSKRGGAWMNELRMQQNVNGFVTPVVTNNFNYPPPTADGPSLLNFTEAQTLFHEFGHGLHGLFSNVKYASLSGTNVPRDFVEFPSQVMENWMSEPEVLKLYAKHYQTGEIIPDDLIARMNAANQFNTGFATVEYMAAAYLDLYWHTITEPVTTDANTFEADAMAKIGLIDEIIPRYRNTYFGHIWGGGYSAGYYAYQWSEVLDADAFAAFKEAGILNKELAGRYRTMLSLGGSKSGMQLYKTFRGQEPDVKHLLAKKGLE